jgi:hypothetical protein
MPSGSHADLGLSSSQRGERADAMGDVRSGAMTAAPSVDGRFLTTPDGEHGTEPTA